MSCTGICERYRAVKQGGNNSRYVLGHKRCDRCDIFMRWDGLRCPCCNTMLRIKPRNRRKLVVDQLA